MSLGGRDNQDPYMGMLDVMMDPAHDDEIEFLRTMSSARSTLTDYFVDGRPTRDLSVALTSVGVAKGEAVGRVATKRIAPSAVRRVLRNVHVHTHEHEHAHEHAHGHEHEEHDQDHGLVTLGLEYDAVATQGWIAADASSMVLLIVSVEKAASSLDASFSFSSTAAGLSESDEYGVSLLDLATGEEVPVSTCAGAEISGTVEIGPRQALAVKVVAKTSNRD